MALLFFLFESHLQFFLYKGGGKEKTHEANKAEGTFNVFHSLNNESMNASQECLHLIKDETSGGVQSSGKGRGRRGVSFI